MNFDDGAVIIFGSSKKNFLEEKKVGRKSKKEVSNHHFDDMKRFTEDPFWIDFLNKMKKGVFPKNYRYVEGYIIYKYRAKTRTFSLEPISKNTFESMKDFFYDNSSIESPRDTQARGTDYSYVKKEVTFAKIKSTGNRLRPALANYVDKFVKKHKFTHDDAIILQGKLQFFINAGLITESDVVLNDGFIEDIPCVSFDKKTRELNFDLHFKSHKSFESEDMQTITSSNSSEYTFIRDEKKKKRKDLMTQWEEFIQNLVGEKAKSN